VTLDPIVQLILDEFPQDLANTDALKPVELRALFKERTAGNSGEEVHSVQERALVGSDGDELLVRMFRPVGVDDPSPITIFFHGGGWVIGDLDTHDAECRALANLSGTVVASVNYRLAPEHPFPAAPEDCYAALGQVIERASEFGLDPARVAVAGDSAGGNLAAVVALMARDRGGPVIRHQLLIYPACDIDPDRWTSISENATGFFLTESSMRWFYRHYVGTERFVDEPYAAPLRAADLSNLPSAQVFTAQYDPLRDEGAAYAAALASAGVNTHYECVPRLIHGFWSFADMVPAAAEVRESACYRLAAALR
jgi:acetyl esterase